jgi:hypothetical protein
VLSNFFDSFVAEAQDRSKGRADEYRGYAEDCMRIADRMPADARPRLLKMAAAWLELARSELQAGLKADPARSPSTNEIQ